MVPRQKNLGTVQHFFVSGLQKCCTVPKFSGFSLKSGVLSLKSNLAKMRNPGIMDFSLISNKILKGIHIEENLSKNEKSRNEGFLFNF